MDGVRLTHVGGPTVPIEVAGRRLPTDPTFDPPGRRWSFGWGGRSRKLTGPAVEVTDLLPIDAVHHEGWSHPTEGREASGRVVAQAPDDVRRSVRWLPLGERVEPAAARPSGAPGGPGTSVSRLQRRPDRRGRRSASTHHERSGAQLEG